MQRFNKDFIWGKFKMDKVKEQVYYITNYNIDKST